MKQSFSWWCFVNRGADDATLLSKAREIGYFGVELIGAEKFQQVLDAGLAIVSHGGHGSIEDGLNNPTNHDRIEGEIIANLELATKYGIPNLIVFSGNRRDGLTDEQGAEYTAAGLSRVAKAAEQAGVTLIIEYLNSKVDHKGYQADRMAWISGVLDAVGSPNVKCLYDIYHAQVMEGDIIRTIQDNHAQIGHYHTAGNPGRNDMDETQEMYYPPIFRAIQATGYTGYVGHEFVPKADPVAAVKAAFDLTETAVA
ncbi:MAG TPA: TIM barrel protein [Capsulimonadaceae bacterium]|jgi:hydroxypyruvate isomerase